jgi:thiamine biosynthesis lipoprotein
VDATNTGASRILIPRALSPAAFATREAGGRIAALSGRSMGTDWNLRVVSPPPGVSEGVQAALDGVVAQMSQWEENSDISLFNRAREGQWRMLPPEFAAVLHAALEVSQASGGAFDPAIGALVDLWGFGPGARPEAAPTGAITAAMVAGRGHVEFDPPGLRARRIGQARLDFSGIAKGFGVDKAAEWLLAQGLRHFLIEVGGELRGHGLRPDGHPWWVDIEPPPGCDTLPMRVALHELSVATSGDYRRWLDVDGQRFSHTLDPRTGRPVDHGLRSVTVLHRSCMLADAWATALGVAGAEAGLAMAEAQGLAAYFIEADSEHMSAAWRELLD